MPATMDRPRNSIGTIMDVLSDGRKNIAFCQERLQKLLIENVKMGGKQSWEWKGWFGDIFDVSG